MAQPPMTVGPSSATLGAPVYLPQFRPLPSIAELKRSYQTAIEEDKQGYYQAAREGYKNGARSVSLYISRGHYQVEDQGSVLYLHDIRILCGEGVARTAFISRRFREAVENAAELARIINTDDKISSEWLKKQALTTIKTINQAVEHVPPRWPSPMLTEALAALRKLYVDNNISGADMLVDAIPIANRLLYQEKEKIKERENDGEEEHIEWEELEKMSFDMSSPDLSDRERWSGKRHTSEKPIDFLVRIYGDLLKRGLRRSDVERYDKKLINALRNDGKLDEATALGLLDQSQFTDRQAEIRGIKTDISLDEALLYLALAQRAIRRHEPSL